MEEKELKKSIRKKISALRKQMTSQEVEEKSTRIFNRVLESDVYRQAETIFAYVDLARNHEVATRAFIERAWKDGKKVAVPKCEGPEMRFWYITYFGQLEPGMMGILEPITHCPGIVSNADADEHALMLMPGVAFDTDRHRVGYGGGFYDKYLSRHPEHPTLAAAFDFQILDAVPFEETDIRPDMIFTESREIRS